MQPFQFAEFVDRRSDSIDFEHFRQNCAVLLFNRADTKTVLLVFVIFLLSLKKTDVFHLLDMMAVFSTSWPIQEN